MHLTISSRRFLNVRRCEVFFVPNSATLLFRATYILSTFESRAMATNVVLYDSKNEKHFVFRVINERRRFRPIYLKVGRVEIIKASLRHPCKLKEV